VLVWYCAAAERNHFLAVCISARDPGAGSGGLGGVNHTAEQLKSIDAALSGCAMRRSAGMEHRRRQIPLAILWAAGNELLVPFGFLIESALGTMFDFTGRHNQEWRKATRA